MLAQDVRVCYETHFVREPVGKQLHNLSPGGATYASSAGKSGKKDPSPGGTTEFRNSLVSPG
jgi:hypothetical protein